MSNKFLNKTGLEHFWGKVKSNLDLIVNTSDIITNDEIDGMFETSTPVVPPATLVTPVVERYSNGNLYYLRIANMQEGYKYYYTLNTDTDSFDSIPDAPADPTKESTLYTGPIDISLGMDRYEGYYIKVIAYVGSKSSDIVELYGVYGGGGIGK